MPSPRYGIGACGSSSIARRQRASASVKPAGIEIDEALRGLREGQIRIQFERAPRALGRESAPLRIGIERVLAAIRIGQIGMRRRVTLIDSSTPLRAPESRCPHCRGGPAAAAAARRAASARMATPDSAARSAAVSAGARSPTLVRQTTPRAPRGTASSDEHDSRAPSRKLPVARRAAAARRSAVRSETARAPRAPRSCSRSDRPASSRAPSPRSRRVPAAPPDAGQRSAAAWRDAVVAAAPIATSRGTAACASASGRARRRTKRHRIACPPDPRRPVRATCSPACRSSSRPSSTARTSASARCPGRSAAAPAFASPKSSTFSAPVARDHDVARLEIAMDDAGVVGAGQRVGDLRRVIDRLGDRRVGLFASRSASVSPRMNSIAMKSRPASLSIS